MKFLLYISLFFCSITLFSQNHSDCNTALVLKEADTINVLSSSIWKVGSQKEFAGKLSNDSVFVPEERQSIWYLFPINKSGAFSFMLKAKNASDDWDFMLFKVKNYPNTCADIEAKTQLPVRSNMANNKMYKKGKTGLKPTAKHKFIAPGFGNPFCKTIKVQRGDTLLLYTGNWDKNGDGQQLSWKIIPPPKPLVYVAVKVEDALTKQNVKANFTLYNAQTDKKIQFKSKTHIVKGFDLKTHYVLNISANGYNFKTIDFNFPTQRDTVHKIVFLSPLKKGSKINLPNIQFVSGQAAFLHSSMPYLNSLLDFMVNNKTVEIEIQGYVNGPNEPNSNYFIKLSEQRAEAVKNYLVKNSIDGNRITTKGFGNEDMIFPNPKDAAENEANRRVEIEVTQIK